MAPGRQDMLGRSPEKVRQGEQDVDDADRDLSPFEREAVLNLARSVALRAAAATLLVG